ncbi:MAG: 2,3-bisphosphoglycerate-independent phosphoglycerate mutase [bacterium]
MSSCLLAILDGFGIGENAPDNAIVQANHPTFTRLFSEPHARLWTHGHYVGLPDGQTGGSEVGHLTIGAGRICPQTLVRVDTLFSDTLSSQAEYQAMLEYTRTHNNRIHIVMIFSDGGIHSSTRHLHSLLKILPAYIDIQLHIASDGRDVSPTSLPDILHEFDEALQSGRLHISTLFGRYLGFDRDNNWDRIKSAYYVMTQTDRSGCQSSKDIITLAQERYTDGVMDEYHEPVAFSDGLPVVDGDVLWCLNFRADRGREISQAFSDSVFEGFDRGEKLDIFYLATFKYYPTFTGHFLLDELDIRDTLPEVIAKSGKTQLHISETDKFIHVTKFFAGLNSEPYAGQKNEIFASYKEGLFSEKPEMEAEKICQYLIDNAANYDFTIVNFPNGDLVGHCGKPDACIRAVQKLGDVVQELIDWASDKDMTLIITADHGNCERMGTPENPDTAHTKNPVPCWIIR